ncbi:winged helix-turn-helix transcriptional regulator [Candidatus Proelusimicrobium volucris]|uniref:winged helix-turn-helix transcriptional regulator n=1 Tax=Candidatus Proelusimicrobium volucris TaxID=3416225 RepID=UPI003D0BDA2A
MNNKKTLPLCPVAIVLQLIGNKWKILIIRDLLCGVRRFGQLQKSIGCSQKVLTDNLRQLEENKLLKRKVYPEVPPRVEYSLSPLGQTLDPLLKEMAKWGEYYRTLI